ncbi:hypothetical protein [Paenibacillus sp. OSY-SE]|uniref:hypothetical protein n=1 Tax=Paenibacillus sp. OSY-SE TaxID=1196323 RepID=UPI0003110A26|nr:hypothetical protein [Paenibacillus sp. OSY-SE]
MMENSPPQYGRIIKEHVLMFAGIIIIVFGLMIVTGSIIGTDSEMSAGAQLALVLLVGVMPALLGGWMCFASVMKRRQRKQEELEIETLVLAASHGGRLTPAELAMHTRISVQKASSLLEHFVKQKAAILKIADNGTYVYEFDGLLDDREKAEAQSLKELIYGEPM